MARRKRENHSEEDYYRRHIYGGWDPHSIDYIYLENGAYDDLERQLSYYRRHPENVKPDELLRLLGHIMDEWQKDTARYNNAMKDLMARYDEMLSLMRDREEEYVRLKGLLREIQNDLREQEARQVQLDERLRTLEEERSNNRSKANELRNEAVEAFNNVSNDPYFKKYASPELDAIRQQLTQLDQCQLSAEAIQAVAINALNRVFSATMMVGRKKLEFSTAQLLADTEASLTIEQFIHWRDSVYFDDEQRNKADMDFWSYGHFNEEMERAQALCNRIRGGELAIGYMVEDLEQDMEQIKSIREEAETTVASVFNYCNVSEQCQQLGLITAALLCEDFHFKLIANGYDDDDFRHGYVIEMENHAMGCRIRFVFSPISDVRSIGCYQMFFLDYIDMSLMSSFEQKLLSMLRANEIPVRMPTNKELGTLAAIVDNMEFTLAGNPIHLPEEMRIWEKQRVQDS